MRRGRPLILAVVFAGCGTSAHTDNDTGPPRPVVDGSPVSIHDARPLGHRDAGRPDGAHSDATHDAAATADAPERADLPDAVAADSQVLDATTNDGLETCSSELGPCDVLRQCGCESGNTCDADYWEVLIPTIETYCRPIGPKAVGDACESNRDCGFGATCDFGGLMCRASCARPPECTAPGGHCLDLVRPNSSASPSPSVCTENCDPLKQTGCPSERGCYLASVQRSLYTYCSTPGPGLQGSACEGQSACKAGYICLNGGCRKLCEPGITTCATPTSCTGTVGQTLAGMTFHYCTWP
jgi:hypothetical protein